MVNSFLIPYFLTHGGLTGSPAPNDEPTQQAAQTLNWAPCDLPFPNATAALITNPIDCATLEVPLDYSNQGSDKTLTLTLIKHNATTEDCKGSIIMNPGGPGGSGIEEIATKGAMYRDILFGGEFNVIGFDVRGVGKTMPFACDLTETWNSEPNYNSSTGTIHFPTDSDTPLQQYNTWELLNSKAWDDAKKFSESCVKNNEEIAPYLGTASVARDMLRIVDALGEDGLLRFWGRSYSTTLGQTFAAMFPDRVGRMVLDSVMRPSDYWSGSWLTAARGTDEALMNILNECVMAGPEFCPIANLTGAETSGESLMTALNEAFQDLLENPILLDESYQNYLPWWRPGGVPLFHEVKNAIFQMLYNPNQVSSLLPILSLVLTKEWKSFLVPSNETTPVPEEWSEGAQAYHGIACGDSTFRADEPEDMYSMLRAQRTQGSFNDAFAPMGWVCSQWKFKAAERFEGNFKDINTSFPILFVNSPYDPITPLSTAWEASAAFQGSRLLTHKGHGHGFMNHPSSCSIKVVGEYFAKGVMPAYGTECEPDLNVFETWLESLKAAGVNVTTNEKRTMEPSMKSLYEMSRRDAMTGKAQLGGWV